MDFGRLDEAMALARRVADAVGMFKINAQLFTAAGPDAVRKLGSLGPGIFLDLKYHDIPNTVAGAVAAAAALPNIELLNVHASGGRAMMEAASAALAKAKRGKKRPKLLGVTVLTSMDRPALREVGISSSPLWRVVSLAELAERSGLDGVVASPLEIGEVRKACGKDFLIVTPGIRPTPTGGVKRTDDQARVATPGTAIEAGADYLVVGRPITAAADPPAAAESIVREIATSLK